VSALVIGLGVRWRPPAHTGPQRSPLLRETAEGFRLVFGSRVLRPIAVLVFTVTMFAIVPEGLAAGWAAELNPDPSSRGLDQGIIMAAGPVGWIIGGLLVSRLVRPDVRQKLVRPLSIAAALALVPALAAPAVPVIALFILISGVAQGGIMPTLNGLFVLALPHGYRARAFGVMQGGLQISQGGAVLLTGLVAQHSGVPVTVGLWSVAGALILLAIAARWPRPAAFSRAIAAAAAASPQPAFAAAARSA
jgi:MFS family permease